LAAPRRLRAYGGPERGSSSLEFAGLLPLLLVVAMAVLQLGIAGYAVQQAGTGARAAARTAGRPDASGEYAATGKAAMSGWVASHSSFRRAGDGDAVRVTANVTIPSLVPGVHDFGTASRTATMPRE